MPAPIATIPPEPFAAAAAHAQTLSGWALLIFGGSVAALLQNSNRRPAKGYFRCIYLLFPVGWILLGRAIYYGAKVNEVHLSALFNPGGDVDYLVEAINEDLVRQVHAFELSIVAFALWLLLYLIWWLFDTST